MSDFQPSSAPVYLSLFLPPLPEQKEPQEYPVQYSLGSLGFSLFLLLPLLLCTGQRGGDGVRHHIESEKSFHIMAYGRFSEADQSFKPILSASSTSPGLYLRHL